jgi:hypothetical protein
MVMMMMMVCSDGNDNNMMMIIVMMVNRCRGRGRVERVAEGSADDAREIMSSERYLLEGQGGVAAARLVSHVAVPAAVHHSVRQHHGAALLVLHHHAQYAVRGPVHQRVHHQRVQQRPHARLQQQVVRDGFEALGVQAGTLIGPLCRSHTSSEQDVTTLSWLQCRGTSYRDNIYIYTESQSSQG